MDVRPQRAADPVSLEPHRLDEPPRELARRVAERRAEGRPVEGLGLPPPVAVRLHGRLALRDVAVAERELDAGDHRALGQVAGPVGEAEGRRLHEAEAVGGRELHPAHHVLHLADLRPRVHRDGPAERPGDARDELHPDEAEPVAPDPQAGGGLSGAEDEDLAARVLWREVRRDAEHHPAHAGVGDEGVRPAAEDVERDAELAHRAQELREGVGVGWADEEVGGAAHADGRARRERGVPHHVSPDALDQVIAPVGGHGAIMTGGAPGARGRPASRRRRRG